MTTTDLRQEAEAIAVRRGDSIQVLTIDQRAGFLRELAEHVENETRWALKPFTEALPGIVPAVAPKCPEPLVVFDRLVGALEEQRKFTEDPAGYADTHDWGTSNTALDNLNDRLQSNVDSALQALLEGGA